MALNPLTKSSIIIEFDEENYNVEFMGCNLTRAYALMKFITEKMESEEFYENGITVQDRDGNTLTGADARATVLKHIHSGGDGTDKKDDPSGTD